MEFHFMDMDEVQYAAFRGISKTHHTQELVDEENLTPEEAEAEAERELQEMLPDGPNTPSNQLISIIYRSEMVGYLWFLTEVYKGIRQAFLCDLYIREDYRRCGAASSALAELEKRAASAGCTECVLFVSEANTAARSLYQKAGYQLTQKHNYGAFLRKFFPKRKVKKQSEQTKFQKPRRTVELRGFLLCLFYQNEGYS